jgi:hypothetical protein
VGKRRPAKPSGAKPRPNLPRKKAIALYEGSRFKDENQFEAWVIKILRVNGWIISSMKDSRRQRWDVHAGIHDIVAVHPQDGKVLFAELKMPGKGQSASQRLWHDAIGIACSKNPELYGMVWYPKDEQQIINVAGGKVPLA